MQVAYVPMSQKAFNSVNGVDRQVDEEMNHQQQQQQR